MHISGLRPFRWGRAGLSLLGLILITHIIYYWSTTPTNDGPWKPYYERVAGVEQAGGQYLIRNFRRARFDAEDNLLSVSWEGRKVNLDDLKSVWLGISVFVEPALAHTFLSFDFGDGDPLVVSIEARQRPGQSYSPVRGLYDAYHLTYVLADERDIIGVRTHARGEKVYFHPLTIEPDTMRTLFKDMMGRARTLETQPDFYNTLTGNCTNSLLRDAPYSAIRRYLDPRIMLPGFADRAAWSEGIIDKRYALESLQRAALIDPASYDPEQADMSAFLRSHYYRKLASEKMLAD